MSVLIKGMEMPNNCGECFLYGLESAGNGMYWDYCRGMRQIIDNPDDGRDSYCPLVPVPSHGRLIEADALIEAIVNTPSAVQNKDIPLANQYDGAAFRQIEILGMIDVAPTIIPAEEGE